MMRFLRCLALVTVILTTNALPPAYSQEEPSPEAAAGSGGSGNPLYAYVGTAFLGAAAVFVLCKSARR